MKKILLAGLIGLLPAFMMAQNVAINGKIKSNTDLQGTVAGTGITAANLDTKTAKEVRKAERETRHFAKTTKAFRRDFKNVSGAQWTSEKDAYVVTFTKDNIRNIVWYGKGGGMIYTMLSYSADKLPRREKDVIQAEYGGYKITYVNEVRQNNIIVYVVHLEDERNIKLVTVCDGLTNIYRAYKKM